MADNSYNEILKPASDGLSREELLKLSEARTTRAVQKSSKSQRSIMELRGLGKEVWVN